MPIKRAEVGETRSILCLNHPSNFGRKHVLLAVEPVYVINNAAPPTAYESEVWQCQTCGKKAHRYERGLRFEGVWYKGLKDLPSHCPVR